MEKIIRLFENMNDYYRRRYNDPPETPDYKGKCMFCGIPVIRGYYCSKECKDADTHEKG